MKRFVIGTLLCLWCACEMGCGMPLYPKVGIIVDPSTGRVAYQSEMETDLVIGAVEASANPDGTRTLKVGAASQPALVYGAEAVGVMKEYTAQMAEQTKMIDIIGKNAIGQIEAVGGTASQILGGLLGLRSSGQAIGGVTGASIASTCEGLIPQMQDLIARANSARIVLEQLQASQAVAK